MLNRRHIRIKVLQILYSFVQSDSDNTSKGLKELFQSIEKMYDLYILLMMTLPELRHMARHKIDERKLKIRPTEEDLNPNLKFVNNKLIDSIANSKELKRISLNRKLQWLGAEKQEIFRKMYLQVQDSETYFSFMNSEAQSDLEDKEFAIQIFKNEIVNSIYLNNYLEDNSVYWLDDIDLCASMTIKSLKTWDSNKGINVLPMYKPNDNEKEFISILFTSTVENDKELEQIIDNHTDNWELDRIAKMDILLLKLAISELIEFDEIPTKVTLNEYIEISKFYSTPKSNQFINGVLDKVIVSLKDQKKINKKGRGLIN